MDWKTVKLIIYLGLCFSLVISQEPDMTTTEQPPTEEPEEQEPDAATVARYNLNVGAANVDYGPFAAHGKYFPAHEQASGNRNFSYDESHPRGPSRWREQWSQCGANLQSPVNIPVNQCTRTQPMDRRLQYHNSQNQPSSVRIENNGYSIEYLFQYQNTPVLYGGPLSDGYIFEFIHFHWDRVNGSGSEHHLNNVDYEIEMHLGHRNSKYPNLGEAGMHQDGIVVLGFVFRISNNARDRPQFAELDRLTRVNSEVRPSNTNNYRLNSFVGDLNEQILNIRGSLTTPPCSPANWLLAPRIRGISRNDMQKFRRALRNGDPIAPNYRPLQDYQNRQCRSYSP